MKEMDAGTTITKTKIEKTIEKIKNVEGFEKVKFIILYGSAAEGQMTGGSDIDLCIYHDGSPDESSKFRFKVLSELFDDTFDVQIFQQLPIYVRVEVLKGKIIYCKDKQFLYEAAIETIKDFEAFKHKFYDYIGEREIT
ncbi:Nucleotidyltransferase domain protein [Candidatus Methanoperedenaceae archaeon GB37]|nr:Nucleotidyltransferase domain protein [Candidatus Methanoperedenaceae archaeon GB37]